VIGFVAGIIFVPMITHWAALLGVVPRRHGGDFLGPPTRRLLWAAPLAVIHPVPILIAAVVAGGVMAASSLLGAAWEWFFAGLYSNLAFMGLFVLAALRRQWTRRRNRQH
jgi:hypothetical protein